VSDAPLVCLRCGNFVPGAAVPDVPLCESCLESKPSGKDNVFTYPPRALTWLWIRPFTLLAFAAGAALMVAVFRGAPARPGWPIVVLVAVLIGGLVAVLGELFGLVLFYTVLPGSALRAWRRHILERSGLASANFRLVLLARRLIRITDLRMPIEIGVLAEAASGLVFLGERGTRFAFAKERLREGERVLLVMLPPRFATTFEVQGGVPFHVVFFEGRGLSLP